MLCIDFRIRFNSRLNDWVVDIFNLDGEPLVTGRRAVLDWVQLEQFRYRGNLPLGFLTFFDTTNRRIPATRDDLGERVLYLYTEQGDVTELTSEEIVALFDG